MIVKKRKNRNKWMHKKRDYLDSLRINIYGETDLDKFSDFSCGVFLKKKFEVSRRSGKYEG